MQILQINDACTQHVSQAKICVSCNFFPLLLLLVSVCYNALTFGFSPSTLQICGADVFTENGADRPQCSSKASEYHRGLSERPGRLHQKVL